MIYQVGERLHVLDTASGRDAEVPVTIRSDRVRYRPDYVAVGRSEGSFRLAPGGERALIEARGEILNVPVGDGDAVDLTHSSASREKDAVWSPDGAWIAFISDRGGEEEIWLTDQKGVETRQLTKGGLGYLMPPVWSPDSEFLLYSDKFMRLNLVNVDSGKKQVVARGEYDDAWERWGIQTTSGPPVPAGSPTR